MNDDHSLTTDSHGAPSTPHEEVVRRRTEFGRIYRKAFFDFHCHASTTGLAAAYDAEAWADRLRAAHIEAASVFVKCGMGYSYYRKGHVRIVHPELPDGVDMVEEQIAAFHRRGIKASGYYYTFSSTELAARHPEWVLRNADGHTEGDPDLSGIALCLVGPFRDDYLIPHLEEIVTLYDVDAMFFDGTFAKGDCFCASCLKRFTDSTGQHLAPDAPDSVRQRYSDWRLEAFDALRKDIAAAIHQIRPHVNVSFNCAYIPRQPGAVTSEIDSLVVDVYPDNQAFLAGYHGAALALKRRPFEIMNTLFLEWWGGWGCKPLPALQLEAASILAYGGMPWPGYQMTHDYTVPKPIMESLGGLMSFIGRREGLVRDSEPLPYAAVLIAESPSLRGKNEKEPYSSMQAEAHLHASHRCLTECMIPHHLTETRTLERCLDDLRLVIVHNSNHLSSSLRDRLEPWVRRGGHLLVHGTDAFIAELAGVCIGDIYPHNHAYIDQISPVISAGLQNMPILAETAFAQVQPSANDSVVLAALRGVYLRGDGRYLRRLSPPGDDRIGAALTQRHVGEGCVSYMACDLFTAYATHNQWNLRLLLRNLLTCHSPTDLPVCVDSPLWLETTLMRRNDAEGRAQTVVHLVNHHGCWCRNDRAAFLESPITLSGINLHMPSNAAPHSVILHPAGRNLAWEHSDGTLHVRDIEVLQHAAVVITHAVDT